MGGGRESDTPCALRVAGGTDVSVGDASVVVASGAADTVTPETRWRAQRALDSHDAATYLDGCNATIETGATGTNVNDLRVVVVE